MDLNHLQSGDLISWWSRPIDEDRRNEIVLVMTGPTLKYYGAAPNIEVEVWHLLERRFIWIPLRNLLEWQERKLFSLCVIRDGEEMR